MTSRGPGNSTGRCVTVRGGSHSMLRHHHVFDAIAAQFVRATLGGQPPRGRWGEVVSQVLRGQRRVMVTA